MWFYSTLLLVSFCLLVKADQKEIYLNGKNWKLSDEAGRVKDIQATVPGITHMDLLEHGIIDDPYYGYNDQKLQWVAYSNWIYTLKFQLSKDDIDGKVLTLKCDGLDTVANISLNNHPVGYANNYFRRWLFNITKYAKSGDNTLMIRIESAANYSLRMKNNYPYDVPAPGIYIPDVHRNFIRKTQSDFGWDWGPAFVPAGIWQNISIMSYYPVHISTIVPKPFYENKTDSYLIEVLVCVNSKDSDEYSITVTLSVDSTPFSTPQKWVFKVSESGEICQRFLTSPVKANKMDAFLWKPYTSTTQTPKLYNAVVDFTVTNKNGDKVSMLSETKRIGFRNIELVQDPPPNGEEGLLFYFQQTDSSGHHPIYIKGSNFIPMDAFVNRATPEVARRLLNSAIRGNQNMIRIWGGGLYQPDWFYDICDELGLMVWQEFMFAVALYPRNTDFLTNVRHEVTDVARRLGHHPSIVLWSGNNENQDMAYKNDTTVVDYSVLYDQTVRSTMWEEDTTRPYWPSSPSNGVVVDDSEMGLFIQRWGESQDTRYGDVHRYDYDDLCTDVTKFPRPRFASEFGYQSYPSFNTLSKISGPSDWDNNSPFMNHRQHHPDGNKELKDMMSKFFHLPNNTNKTLQFQDFVYLTQVVQTICITAEAEHYRRILSESGYTRGTLYWQLNDIWQAQTWASVEYSGNWKLLHYGMKRVYSEVLVSAYELEGDIAVYVVFDQDDMTLKYDFHLAVIKWSDGSVVNRFQNTSLTSNGFTGIRVYNEKVSDVFKSTSTEDSFLYMSVTKAGSKEILAEGNFFPSSFSDVKLPTPHISVSHISMDQRDPFTINFSVTSDAVAPYVYLESGSINGIFSDNGIVLLPHVQYNMTFLSWQQFTQQDFEKNIHIRSVRDTY